MEAGRLSPILSIIGQLVALGPPHRGVLPLIWRWENDVTLAPLTGDPARPIPFEVIEADYDRYAKEEQPTSARFVIYERASLRPIGTTGLGQINHLHRTAEFGIGIGESDCWGKGYGTEATRLVLDYAFNALGLHNVFLRVYAYNERAIRAYRRAGFQEIGRRREAHRQGGRAFDEVHMDCLSTDFTSSVLRDLLP